MNDSPADLAAGSLPVSALPRAEDPLWYKDAGI